MSLCREGDKAVESRNLKPTCPFMYALKTRIDQGDRYVIRSRSEKCGETRNCLVYNAAKLRTSVVGFMFGWIVITLVLDVMTWYYAKGLQLYDDEEDEGESGKDKDSKDRDSGFQVHNGQTGSLNSCASMSIISCSVVSYIARRPACRLPRLQCNRNKK